MSQVTRSLQGPYVRATQAVSLRFLVLAVYTGIYLALFLPRAEFPSIVLYTLPPTCIALWFGPLGLIMAHGRRKLYDPITLFNSSLFYYSLKGVMLSWGERTRFLAGLSYDVILQQYPLVILYTVLGLVAWNLGASAVMRSLARDNAARVQHPYNTRGLSSRKSYSAAPGVLFLTAIGAASFLMLFRSIGADPLIFLRSSWIRGYLAAPSVFGTGASLANFFLSGLYMLPVGSLVWLAITGYNGRRPGVLWWVYTVVSLALLFIVASRATLLGYVISLLLVYHLSVGRVRASLLALIAGIGILYSYLISLWRFVTGSLQVSSLDAGISELGRRFDASGLLGFLGGGDLADIRIFVLIASAYGRLVPLKYGETLLRVFYQFIPRAIWPSKPLDLGVEIGRLAESGTYSGTPPGFFVIGGFLLGAGLVFLYKSWVARRNPSPLGIVLYAILATRILLIPSNTTAIALVAVAIPMAGALIGMKMCELVTLPDRPRHRGLSPDRDLPAPRG
jgi:hypothetical protein